MIHLGAHIADIYVHYAGEPFKPQVPDLFNHHGARDRTPGVAHEVFQQSIFPLAQLNWLARPLHRMALGIKHQIRDRERF